MCVYVYCVQIERKDVIGYFLAVYVSVNSELQAKHRHIARSTVYI
jgi:hypothetical protein